MPQLVPAGFDISPLPSKISCFIIQALETLESCLTQNKNQPTKRKTESGANGSRSAPRQVSTLTLSSLNCSSLKRSSSCARFSPSSKWRIGFLASVRAPWFRQLRDAAGYLAAPFRSSFKRSPIHVEGSSESLPAIKALLKAFDKTDPSPDWQKATTPKFLRKLFKFLNTATSKLGEAPTLAHVADLALGAFFFAMRSCKHTKSVPIGSTKRVQMGCFVFLAASRRVLLHSDPQLLHHAQHVTIVFEDQKNGKKMDARTNSRSGHQFLCLVLRWGPQCNVSSQPFQVGTSRRHSAR
jgi:hypothetical protein